jgi:hypothetical protein
MDTENKLGLLYALAEWEKEGIGTAYEYLSKSFIVDKIFRIIGKPLDVLIAGLPEKYGYSLDFLLLANNGKCNIDVIDEREDVLREFNHILSGIEKSIFSITKNINSKKVYGLTHLNLTKDYGLVLSPAVLQRIDEESRSEYLYQLSRKTKYAILFVPNKSNQFHKICTHLGSLNIDDLPQYFQKLKLNINILESGFIDLPPFPPGVKIHSGLKKFIKNRSIIKIVMRFLNIWLKLELFLPNFIRRRFSHMVYIIWESKNEANI